MCVLADCVFFLNSFSVCEALHDIAIVYNIAVVSLREQLKLWRRF